MIEWLKDIDTSVFLFLNGIHSEYFDSFMWIATTKWIWIPFYLSLLVIVARIGNWRKVAVVLCYLGLAVALADQLGATVIRPLVERLRPSNLDNPISSLVHIVNDYRGGAYGFPSCHAANSFALAVFLSLVLRNRKLSAVLFVWAAVNSYSRLYLGVHYPGDLLVGALLGTVVALVMASVARWISCKIDVKNPGLSIVRQGDEKAVILTFVVTVAAIATYSFF